MKKRYYGIDLLRVVSMNMIVGLHIYGQGGVLSEVSNYGWIPYIMMYCAVDCYALITGIVCYSEDRKKINYVKYINMWFQVMFYGVSICAVLKVFNIVPVQGIDLFNAILPITRGQYWYFTAYMGLMVVRPFLDKLICQCEKKEAINFIVVMFIVMFFYSILTSLGFDPLRFSAGYSFSWLIVLYVFGAFIKKFDLHKIIKKPIICYLFLVFITWLSKILIGWVTELILGAPNRELIFLSYISPTIFGCAICLVSFFYDVKFPERIEKVISYVAPNTFGVYLLHVQPVVFGQLIVGGFCWILKFPELVIPIVVFITSLIIFFLGVCFEKIRAHLFEILKIGLLSSKIEMVIRNTVTFIVNYISDVVEKSGKVS